MQECSTEQRQPLFVSIGKTHAINQKLTYARQHVMLWRKNRIRRGKDWDVEKDVVFCTDGQESPRVGQEHKK